MTATPGTDASSIRALTVDPANLDALIGDEFVGDWLELDVHRVKAFDHATFTTENAVPMAMDLYPNGLIEGFNSIGLLDRLHERVFHVVSTDSAPDGWGSKLHAIEKIRWTSRIEAGQPMRARGTVTGATAVAGGFILELDVVVEVEGREKPGLVVRWSQRWSPVGETPALSSGDAQEIEQTSGEASADDVLVVSAPFEQIPEMVGRPFRGVWIAVDEKRRQEWAYCTSAAGDPVDRDVRPSGLLEPAHVLALLDHLCNRVLNVSPGPWFGWNYGLDAVVFGHDVRVGERIRLTGSVASVAPRGEGFVPCIDVALEVEGRREPVVAAQWRVTWLPPEDHS